MLNDTNTAYSTECNFYGVSNTANLQPQRGEITNQVNGVDRVRSSIKRPWVNRSRPIISATTRASGNCLAIPGNFRRRASVVQRSTDDQCRLPRNRRIKFAGLRREMSTTNLHNFQLQRRVSTRRMARSLAWASIHAGGNAAIRHAVPTRQFAYILHVTMKPDSTTRYCRLATRLRTTDH